MTPQPVPVKPLERSSLEFMAALTFSAIVQLITLSWLVYLVVSILIACLGIYFCWRSRATFDYGPGRKTFLSICCAFFVFSISYNQIVQRYQDANKIPFNVPYLTSWGNRAPFTIDNGNPPKVTNGMARTAVTADGRLLDKFKDKFNLMAAVFHIVNAESYMDKEQISRSALVKIHPEDMTIPIDYNTTYLVEQNQQQGVVGGEMYVLLAVPKGMGANDFTTLNDAEGRGVQIIGRGSVGPAIAQSPCAQPTTKTTQPVQTGPKP
jgi:hypothetical protein